MIDNSSTNKSIAVRLWHKSFSWFTSVDDELSNVNIDWKKNVDKFEVLNKKKNKKEKKNGKPLDKRVKAEWERTRKTSASILFIISVRLLLA